VGAANLVENRNAVGPKNAQTPDEAPHKPHCGDNDGFDEYFFKVGFLIELYKIFNNGSERQVAVRSHHVEVSRRRFKKKRNIRNSEKQQYSSMGLAIPHARFGWAIPASRHAHFQRLPLGLPASLSPSFSSFLDDADGRDLLHMTSVRPRRTCTTILGLL
jgi:hypothetical protein